jgi:anti-sigma factor RsiW
MKCNEVREHFLDLASGPLPAAATQHVAECSACAAEMSSMQATMALLDEWQTPEPSPYFDMRLHARLREEAAAPVGVWERLRAAFSPAGLMNRKMALASVMAILLVIGGAVMFNSASGPTVTMPQAQVGTPVGDLMVLDKNHDLYADFDLLDDVDGPNAQQQPQEN